MLFCYTYTCCGKDRDRKKRANAYETLLAPRWWIAYGKVGRWEVCQAVREGGGHVEWRGGGNAGRWRCGPAERRGAGRWGGGEAGGRKVSWEAGEVFEGARQAVKPSSRSDARCISPAALLR